MMRMRTKSFVLDTTAGLAAEVEAGEAIHQALQHPGRRECHHSPGPHDFAAGAPRGGQEHSSGRSGRQIAVYQPQGQFAL